MIKVIITDDHPLIREGIKKILNKEIDIEVMGEASNGSEALSLLGKQRPDLLILDITMQGKSGLELLKDIKVLFGQLAVLILSVHSEKQFALRALKAGAQGYLCKTNIPEELVSAIRKITQRKKKYITSQVARLLAGQLEEEDELPHAFLSDREFEVLRLIAMGRPINKIAAELRLSPHTIHTYRRGIKEKLNVDSDVEITRDAIDNNLVE